MRRQFNGTVPKVGPESIGLGLQWRCTLWTSSALNPNWLKFWPEIWIPRLSFPLPLSLWCCFALGGDEVPASLAEQLFMSWDVSLSVHEVLQVWKGGPQRFSEWGGFFLLLVLPSVISESSWKGCNRMFPWVRYCIKVIYKYYINMCNV